MILSWFILFSGGGQLVGPSSQGSPLFHDNRTSVVPGWRDQLLIAGGI